MLQPCTHKPTFCGSCRTVETTQPKALFIENPKSYQALQAAGLPAGRFPHFADGRREGARTLDDLRQLGREAAELDATFFDLIKAEFSPEDYAILYMTSGATGELKMGLVTHASVVSNLDMGPAVVPIGPNDSSLVFRLRLISRNAS
ncbi:MAG: hypothetical protein WKF37_04660 [Bryobacteraceae bacterium]